MEQSCYEGKIRFHLHPDIELHLGTDNVSGKLRFPDGAEADWSAQADRLSIENNRFAWEFGKTLRTKTLVLHQVENSKSVFEVEW